MPCVEIPDIGTGMSADSDIGIFLKPHLESLISFRLAENVSIISSVLGAAKNWWLLAIWGEDESLGELICCAQET